MRKQKGILYSVIFLLLFSIILQVGMSSATQSTQQIQVGTGVGDVFYPTVDYGVTAVGYGPGSEVQFRTPMESEYVWVDPVEPTKVTWKFYQPGYRPFLTIEHEITYKKRITEGTNIGMWAFADTATFTVPALAETGSWLAKPEITMADGTIRQGVSAENPGYIYIAFPVVGGSWVTNWFGAPWYFFGVQMPPLFWIPGVFAWGPALFIGICFVSPKVSDTFQRGFGRLKEAGSKWKK